MEPACPATSRPACPGVDLRQNGREPPSPSEATGTGAAPPEVEPSDEALCVRVAARDEEAFDLLVERYQRRAYRLAWSLLRDAEDARDASQDAFIRVYEAAASFGGRSRFSTWFYRILVNVCLDRRRRRRWWSPVLASPDGGPAVERHAAPAIDPDARLGREQVMTRLWAEVEHLSPQQRAALLLHVQEELATADIASVLGCSEATVRVHLHRAVSALRKRLGEA
jgi:RNA polymerase sigma-70 factor (ECF subfamily)